MRHSLFKYYAERKWGEAFLNGELLFRSLSYFRDYEDKGVRGDTNEGTAIFQPTDGLVITNHTQGWKRVFPGAFKSTANQEEILVFCLSRSLTDELRARFGATVSVEIVNVKEFCTRIEASLPHEATFPGKPGRTRIGQRVEYYRQTDSCNPRWALPDVIAASKLDAYSWQDEYRLIFSLTDALEFQKIETRLVRDGRSERPKFAEHRKFLLKVGSLRDICRFHDFESRKIVTEGISRCR
jgi:hypothetical protein